MLSTYVGIVAVWSDVNIGTNAGTTLLQCCTMNWQQCHNVAFRSALKVQTSAGTTLLQCCTMLWQQYNEYMRYHREACTIVMTISGAVELL